MADRPVLMDIQLDCDIMLVSVYHAIAKSRRNFFETLLFSFPENNQSVCESPRRVKEEEGITGSIDR